MKFQIIIALSSAIVSPALFSCSEGKVAQNHDAARLLFQKSRILTEEYIDSIKCAKDSASVITLANNFDNNLTDINYRFPPDTDFELTEDENDSLIRMSIRLTETVRNKLESFKIKAPADSIASSGQDSIGNQVPLPFHIENN